MNDSVILDNELAIGKELTISAKTARGNLHVRAKVVYQSKHHFRVKVLEPIHADILIPGQPVTIRLGGDQSTLPLQAKYLRGNDPGSEMLVISVPEGEWVLNRRAFVRVGKTLPIDVTRSDTALALPGRTLNLSGGGALIEMDAELQMGEHIQLVLEMDDGKPGTVGFRAEVVRVEPVTNPRRYGVRFIQANSRDQNRVCKMVIVKQFEDRREELKELTDRGDNR